MGNCLCQKDDKTVTDDTVNTSTIKIDIVDTNEKDKNEKDKNEKDKNEKYKNEKDKNEKYKNEKDKNEKDKNEKDKNEKDKNEKDKNEKDKSEHENKKEEKPKEKPNNTILHQINQMIEVVKVAIKFPHGKNAIVYKEEKKEFEPCENINQWLESLYKNSRWTGWVVYNDETSHIGNTSHKKGHCKGIVAWNDTHVSWLVHSVPNFPKEFSGNMISEIEKSEYIYGQSFLYTIRSCDTSFLEKVIQQVYRMDAHIFMRNNEPAIPLFKDNLIHSIVWTDRIQHKAKPPKCEVDIYSEHLVLQDTSTWFVETWKRGCHIETYCKNLTEIQTLQFCDVKYKESQDHSKWAISDNHVWVGDLNRMTSQYKRGGGGFLLYNKDMAHAFRKLVIN